MLTDDQLTDDLGAAFRAATADLRYAGRVPSPRPSPLAVVPVLAVGAALVVPTVLGQAGGSPTAAPDQAAPTAGPTAGPSTGATTRATAEPTPPAPLVTESVRLAGYRLSWTRPATGGPGRLHVVAGVDLPAGATRLPDTGTAAVWSGVDAVTGDAALFVSPTGERGDVFELTGTGWSAEALAAVQSDPEPTTVPRVTR